MLFYIFLQKDLGYFFVSIYMLTNANEKEQKVAPIFYCKFCDYTSSRKNNMDKHFTTTKHKMLTNANEKEQKVAKVFVCESCSKEYKHKSSLCRHKTKCAKRQTQFPLVVEGTKNMKVDKSPTIIALCNVLQELIKVQKETKVIQNTQNISINVFLNEHCKDAINLKDFVENLKLTDNDLLKTKELGYVGGISNIFIKNLNDLPIPKRPIHCADTKRLKFYIKDKDGWNHKNSEEKMEDAIHKVTMKQIRTLEEWQNNNPNYMNDPKLRDEWHAIVQQIMGASNDKERERNKKYIKKAIGEETVLKEAIMKL